MREEAQPGTHTETRHTNRLGDLCIRCGQSVTGLREEHTVKPDTHTDSEISACIGGVSQLREEAQEHTLKPDTQIDWEISVWADADGH